VLWGYQTILCGESENWEGLGYRGQMETRYFYTMKPMRHTQACFCIRLALCSIFDTVDVDCVSDTAPGNFLTVHFGLTQSLMPSTVRSSSDISSRGGGMSEDTATINVIVTESNLLKVLNFGWV